MKIEEIKLIVSKQIQVGKNEIKSNLRSHGKVVSGRTLRSLRSETTNTPIIVTGKINKEGTRLFKQGGRTDIYTPVVSTIKKNILVALNKSSVLAAANVVKFEHIDLKMTI